MKRQKNKKWSRLVIAGIAFCSSVLMAGPASAVDMPEQQDIKSSIVIEPRYTGLRVFSATLTIDNSGKAVCIGNARTNAAYTCEATLELQQKNNGSWRNVHKWASSGQYNDFEEDWYVKSGYDYRLKLSADIYSSTGKFVTSYTTYSGIVDY